MKSPNVSIQLAVADLETTEAFYVGILELNVERGLTARGAPEHLILRHGGWEILFVDQEDVTHAHPVLGERIESFPKGIGMTLHFRVADIEGVYDALMEEEMEILYPLEVKPYGVKELWCFDPDGYLLVLEEPTR